MIQALLLDLDDTLLGNHVDTFMKGYFSRLSAYAGALFDESAFLPHLIQATRAMIQDTNPQLTNAGAFWRAFEGLTGGRRDELEPFFMKFYETQFEQLRPMTVVRPAALALIQAAFDRDLAVVIATNPLFPRIAIEQRLAWAGIPVGDFDYALVTHYENMHAAKPQPEYYREILAVVGCAPEQALMVGDDWENDIAPAAAVGLHTYWIAPADAALPQELAIQGRGSLDELLELVNEGWLERLGTPA